MFTPVGDDKWQSFVSMFCLSLINSLNYWLDFMSESMNYSLKGSVQLHWFIQELWLYNW